MNDLSIHVGYLPSCIGRIAIDGQHAARHLHEKHGFRLIHQESGNQWGHVVNEQGFERNT